MEIMKRIVNLIYALSNLGWILYSVNFVLVNDMFNLYALLLPALVMPLLAVICLVVNFALFKKFTIWNK